MPAPALDDLLALLRDPNVETAEIAARIGVPREEVGRASRALAAIGRTSPEQVATLPAPLAAALARAALGAGRVDVLAALAGHASKEVAKEAKRGLHLLKVRGVTVPEPPRVPAPAAAPTAEAPLPAYASAVDAQGERAVWIPRNVPGKGVEVGQAVVSDVRGLVDAKVAMFGRKEWRAAASRLVDSEAALRIVEIDRDVARSLVADARRRNDAAGEPVPEGADVWLAHLGPAAPLTDPAARFGALRPDEEAEALASSASLHDLPFLRGWLPDEPFRREIAAKLDEIAVSRIYIDERQRTEQIERTLADAVDAYLDDDRRRLLSTRLFWIAEHLERTGDSALARSAAAAARALRAGVPAREIAFVRRLVEKAFPVERPEASAGAPEAPDPGGLILAP